MKRFVVFLNLYSNLDEVDFPFSWEEITLKDGAKFPDVQEISINKNTLVVFFMEALNLEELSDNLLIMNHNKSTFIIPHLESMIDAKYIGSPISEETNEIIHPSGCHIYPEEAGVKITI